MDKISVIVPIYRVEKYLCRCVDSLLAQTYANMEIILVDDGSPDDCGKICDQYAAEYPHISVIHKLNGGLSSARNAGIAVAKGEYIGFVDSDDYVSTDMYAKLYAAIKDSDADISICNYLYVDELTGVVDEQMRKCSPLCDAVIDRVQALQKLNTSCDGYSFYVTAWNKLYKRELFADCLFREGWIHEDEFLVHHIFSRSKLIATLEEPLYYYVQRKGSITNNVVSIKMLDGVYALYDRFLFFKQEGMRDLAKESLLAAEWKLRTLLPGLSLEAEKIVTDLMKKLLPRLIAYFRPEAMHLIIARFKYANKNRG